MSRFRSDPLQSASLVNERRLQALQFGLLAPETVAKMSVAEVRHAQIYDQQTFLPNFNAVNDPRMGVLDRDQRCLSCKGGPDQCPGHFGHISLHSPVYHAGLLVYVLKILRSVCHNCSKLLACQGSTHHSHGGAGAAQVSFKEQEELGRILKIKNPKTRFKKVLSLADGVKICDGNKGGCGYTQPKYRKTSGITLEIEFKDENFDSTRDRKEIFWPEQALKVLEKISAEDCKLMGLDNLMGRPEWAIIRNLPVAPPPVRPSVTMSSTSRSEDDLTYAYQQVVKINVAMRDQTEKGANQLTLNELKSTLQFFVSTLMDNSIAGLPKQKHKSGKTIKCVRSRLKGKEGRLRGNLMGKRVDFSARTVITPDPNLDLDQLGVPLSVAQNMTIPETVTPQNIHKMRQLVENGPSEWPGAKYIIRHDERQIDLSMLQNRSDVHLEIGYKVERHLQDGDLVLFNRQPSLHKMSIMGHRVKVLPYSTFRLNLSVTTPYNADFDGDEMNMHVPQSYESMAEVKEIMAVPKQIMSAQSNKPVMGIVQDSLLGAMMLTSRDTFVDREEAMQLLMWIPDDEEVVHLPRPTILKPKALWTGKQIFSLLIPNINLSSCKDRDNKFGSFKDANVLIDRGELLQGQLVKQQIGCSGSGVGHLITREYGHAKCATFLSAVQKLVNNWLLNNGFTVGVQDIIVGEKEVSSEIQGTLDKFKRQVDKIISRSNKGQLKSQPGKTMLQSFEASVNKKLNDARDKSGNLALDGLSQKNRLVNMVSAGSKGSNINISQIMACVGQQNVEGQRIPYGFNQRTLPHFSKDDFGPESKGFVESSYLKGLNPAELYFHAMGGREGLIDTAVKTAETGYISRRLIKALEDIMVQYDGTVRTSKSDVVQFIYGEDGMAGENIEDVSIDLLRASDSQVEQKCKFVKLGQSQESDRKLQNALTDGSFNLIGDRDQIEAIQKEYKRILESRDALRIDYLRSSTEDQVHLPVNIARLITNAKAQFGIHPNSQSDLTPQDVTSKVETLLGSLNILPDALHKNPGKIILEANKNASRMFGVYVQTNLSSRNLILNERMSSASFDWLLAEIKSRFDTSRVNPGEMVGSLAAQSLGEPATQMTLNTFHFAGISAKNVTLGVPRFREIINVASNIKTPSLKIFLKEKYKKNEQTVMKLGQSIENTTLQHVVSQSGIYYDPNPEKTVIAEDQQLVQLYNDVQVLDEDQKEEVSPWLMRLELDKDKMVHKGLTMTFIEKKLSELFSNQLSLMVSDENSDKQIVRIRINEISDEPEETIASYMKNEFEPLLLRNFRLKGIPQIQKVTYSKHEDHEFCPETGKLLFSDDNWLIETDGTALATILVQPKIDERKTISNDNTEVLKVLGVEAARKSLINELRFVFSSYGIYVNYRHISTLIDVMTHCGKLTSITRHGINRVDTSGPLRKCSFEETVEILLEGAMFGEKDRLQGITENIIVGQLAPFGSGSFDLKIDQDVIEKNSRVASGYNGIFEHESELGDTPMQEEDELKNLMTPMITMTPCVDQAMATGMYTGGSIYSNHSANATPGYQPEMSPRPNHNFASNQYLSPSPQYASPNYAAHLGGGQAALTSAQYASPIYTGAAGNQLSPTMAGAASSSGVGGIQRGPASPIYSGQMKNSGQYGGNVSSGQQELINQGAYSPAYNVQSPMMNAAVSPSYANSLLNSSSNGKQSQGISSAANMISPCYSPSSFVQSPSYSNALVSGSNQPKQHQQVQQQQYSEYSPAYSPSLGTSNPNGKEQFSSSGDKTPINGTFYQPIQSPMYTPPQVHQSTKDNNAVQSPAYQESNDTVAYNPASPQYSLNQKVRRSKRNANKIQGSIKEEHNEHSD